MGSLAQDGGFGDYSAVSAYVDGAAKRSSAGNLAISELDGHVFGIGAYQDDSDGNQGGDPAGGGEGEGGYVGGQTVVWEYGNGENQISGGVITLNSVCEPAWAYDENAGPDEFMDCVDVEDDVDIDAYTISQNNRGGTLRIEPGIKLIFSISPDDGYEFSDMDVIVTPEEAEEHINGMGDDKGFEFVMPENADIRIVVYFDEKDENESDGIEVAPCEDESVCDEYLPEIKSAEAEDAPDGVKIQISYGLDEDAYEENWESFALEIYGSEEKFEEFIEALSDEDMESGKAVADALKKFGKLLVENYDIHLMDGNSGEVVEYTGDGIKITLAMPEDLDWIIEALDEYYDGEYELVMAHIKSDGSVEYLPLTKNSDGTYTFTAKSLSPFGLVVRAAAVNPAPNNNNSANNPVTLDKIATYIALGAASLAGLGAVSLAIRRSVKR